MFLRNFAARNVAAVNFQQNVAMVFQFYLFNLLHLSNSCFLVEEYCLQLESIRTCIILP